MEFRQAVRRRLPAPAVRLLKELMRRRESFGLLSVVVPIYNVEAYVDECLKSLREQDYWDIEIVVVDDGSPDGSRAIAEAHARDDRRVRIVTRPNGGLGAARNTGIDASKGKFLTFIDSDDMVTPNAFTVPVAGLIESGSDFALTSYERIHRAGQQRAGWWIRAAHARRRLGCTLDEFPAIQVNAVACSKVYRRQFWDEAGLRFREGLVYEDQPVSSRAFARARSFDVHPEIGLQWRIREDHSSLTQQNSSPGNLEAHNRAVELSLRELTDAGRHQAAEERALQLLRHNLPFFAAFLPSGADEFRDEFGAALKPLFEHFSRERYAHTVDVRSKVIYELALQRRAEDLADFITAPSQGEGERPTRVSDSGVTVDLGIPGIAADCMVLSDWETRVQSELTHATWTADGGLQLEGYAFVKNVDLGAHAAELRLAFVSEQGEQVAVELERRDSLDADIDGGHEFCDYVPAGFTAKVPGSKLRGTPGTYALEATVSVAGLTRVGSAQISPALHLILDRPIVTERGLIRRILRATDGAVALEVRRSKVYADGQRLRDGRLEVEFRAPRGTRLFLARPEVLKQVVGLKPAGDQTGIMRATAGLARIRRALATEQRVTSLQVLAKLPDHEVVHVAAAPHSATRLDPGPGQGVNDVEIVADSAGNLCLLHRRLAAKILSYGLTDDELIVDLELVGVDEHTADPILRGAREHIPGQWKPCEGGFRASFPLRRTRWGMADLPIPTGSYEVLLSLKDDDALLFPAPSTPVLAHLPREVELNGLTLQVLPFVGKGLSLCLQVNAPIPKQDRSARAQRLLRERAAVPVAARRSVFFRTLYGEVTSGNALAVHEELVRRGADLELCWSIRDCSVSVPEGGRGLVEGTWEWHQAMAQSRYHMVDVHQMDWFTKPSGQVIIQTLHGYPYKVMGHDWWAKGKFSAARVASWDRRAREWDYFVSPASYATPLLKAAFLDPAGAAPEILEIGYPRNDVLLSPEAPRLRERIRERLGIEPGQKVVLYAPTFRDYLSIDDMRARPVDFFAAWEARRSLPDDYVFLMRGHAFNARARFDPSKQVSRIADVTDYPDVNDLILASDVAVLDFSSIRFDYALTDRPMVFLVPDAEHYDAARGGLTPFGATAPGPHVQTTEEVVELLRDLGALDRDFAKARAEFRASYTDLEDGHASGRLVDAVFVPRGDAQPASRQA